MSSSGREGGNGLPGDGDEEDTSVGVTEEEEMLVQLLPSLVADITVWPSLAVVGERKVVRLEFVGEEVEMIVDRKRKRK